MENKLKELVELLQNKLGEKFEVGIVEAEKPDGHHRGISIKSNELDSSLNYYVEERIRAHEPLEEIASKIALNAPAEFREIEQQIGIDVLSETIKDWHAVKKNVIACVCQKKGHESFLKDKVWYAYLDLAVYFRIIMQKGDFRMEYVVTPETMKLWNVSLEEMKQAAIANRPESEIKVLVAELAEDSILPIPRIISFIEMKKQGFPKTGLEDGMMRLSYREYEYSGELITRPDILKQIAEDTGMDLLILPSSRDDIIVFAQEEITQATYDHYSDMVVDVNRTHFEGYEEEKILSDHAYIFSRAKGGVLEDSELYTYFNFSNNN